MADRSSFVTRWFGHFIHRDKTPRKDDFHPSAAEIQSDQIAALSHELEAEKHRNAQLVLLKELGQQLETRLDQPVAAQLAVNTLKRAINCSYVCLLLHEPEQREFIAIVSAGRFAKMIPPDYRQNIAHGMIKRGSIYEKRKFPTKRVWIQVFSVLSTNRIYAEGRIGAL